MAPAETRCVSAESLTWQTRLDGLRDVALHARGRTTWTSASLRWNAQHAAAVDIHDVVGGDLVGRAKASETPVLTFANRLSRL